MIEIDNLVADLFQIKANNAFKYYIKDIHFPFYRNLEVNTTINFDFPLTIFIGQNGCGKSSTLHALYGAVKGKTPSDFWFDTKVDPIAYYDDEKRRHSFWYSYEDDNRRSKQVVKARIKRKNDPNYWETSRPLVWAGMNKGRRNEPIRKEVIYLDFRAELSAFDKFFYFGDTAKLKSRNRQEYLRRRSSSLKKLFDLKKDFVNTRKKKLNEPLENLSKDELKMISFILGREYKSGKFLKHSLFKFEGYSVFFETGFASYSEAFAGSGEMAVVRLVQEVLRASAYSLILLDEPEVSLHPGAQEKLRLFLLEQIKRKKHQIVLSTHSPTIVKGLPKEGIKVFFQNLQSGKFKIKENVLPEQAFFYIDFPIENKKMITVEDKLAKQILEAVLEKMGPESKNLFNIKYHPGGHSVIKKEFVTVYCRQTPCSEFIVFDGDQASSSGAHLDWQTLSTAELTLQTLTKRVHEQVGVNIEFSVDGGEQGGNEEQKIELYKQYLDYYLSNVFYLPGKIPEDVIWDFDLAKNLIEPFLSKPDLDHKVSVLQSKNSFKDKFVIVTAVLFENSTAGNIDSVHQMFIKHWKDTDSNSFVQIKDILDLILNNV